MDVVLIPGLWLDGSAWDDVLPALAERGHHGRAVTLPGQGDGDPDATLDDQVAAVLAAVDESSPGVVVVGHSAACALAWIAADARPDRVGAVVLIGGHPVPDGDPFFAHLEPHDGVVEFPGWEVFEGPDSADLDEDHRRRFARAAHPVPEAVTGGVVTLRDERRFDVPVTLICPEFTPDQARGWLAEGHMPELARVDDLELVDLDSGHWPMFTRPRELAALIATVADRRSESAEPPSDAGVEAFRAADGVEDWVLLHGGATAVYRVDSLDTALALAGRIAAIDKIDDELRLGLAHDRVTVRLTRDIWSVAEQHVGVARAVSSAAAELGARADRAAVQEVQLAVAARPDDLDVGFWRAVLGYDPMAPDNAVDPLGHGSTVWMQELDPDKPLRHAMHVDVSVAREHARPRLDAALAAGGRIVDDAEAPSLWILADRAGNRVCIAAWPDGA